MLSGQTLLLGNASSFTVVLITIIMKLNIETKDPTITLEIIQQVYFNHKVELLQVYESTADYAITTPPYPPGERVYPLEGLMEVASMLDVPLYKIRIY